MCVAQCSAVSKARARSCSDLESINEPFRFQTQNVHFVQFNVPRDIHNICIKGYLGSNGWEKGFAIQRRHQTPDTSNQIGSAVAQW